MTAHRAFAPGVALMGLMVGSLCASGQATTFRGRLIITAEGINASQVRVTLRDLGTDDAKPDGSFAISIPSRTTTVDLSAELNGRKLSVTSPRNPINVPLSSAAVTDIFIGPTIEQFLADALGPVRARLESSGRAAGARDSSILNALNDLTRSVAEMARVQVDVLIADAARAQKRSQSVPVISRALELFDLNANNVHQVFQYVASAAFTNDSAYALLKRTINDYKPALDSLYVHQGTLKQLVEDNWGQQQSAALQSVLDAALGDIHDGLIYPMNRLIPKIDSVLRGRIRGNAAAAARDEVLRESTRFVLSLTPKLALLRDRKTRLMTALQSP